jgi:hypothetical protein
MSKLPGYTGGVEINGALAISGGSLAKPFDFTIQFNFVGLELNAQGGWFVYEGTGCDSPGDHLLLDGTTDVDGVIVPGADPWLNAKWNSNGQGQATGSYFVNNDKSLRGRTVVVHLSNGVRAACGIVTHEESSTPSDDAECTVCDSGRCGIGKYLSGCGADEDAGNAGVCLPCSASYLPVGANWTSEGKLLDVPTSCWWKCDNGFDNNEQISENPDSPCVLQTVTPSATPSSAPTPAPTPIPTALPTPAPGDDCDYVGSPPSEIFILVDSSTSIEGNMEPAVLANYGFGPSGFMGPAPHFSSVISDIKNFTSTLGGLEDNARGGGTRVGLAQFSFGYNPEWSLGAYGENRSGLLNAFDRLRWRAGVTNTGHAIERVVEELKATARPNSERILVLIIDGASYNETHAEIMTDRMRADGIVTYVVGYGPDMGTLAVKHHLSRVAGDHKMIFEGKALELVDSAVNGKASTFFSNGRFIYTPTYDGVGDALSHIRSKYCAYMWPVAKGCFNKVQNDFETDTDCGGIMCKKCSEGQLCEMNADCESGGCMTSGRCSSFTPTLPPTGAPTDLGSKSFAVESTMTINGYSVSTFTASVQNAFRNSVASYLSLRDGITVYPANVYIRQINNTAAARSRALRVLAASGMDSLIINFGVEVVSSSQDLPTRVGEAIAAIGDAGDNTADTSSSSSSAKPLSTETVNAASFVAQFSQALTNSGIVGILQPAGLSVYLVADVTISVESANGASSVQLLSIAPNPNAEAKAVDGLSRTTIVIIIVCIVVGLFILRYFYLSFCVATKSTVGGDFDDVVKLGDINGSLSAAHNGDREYTNVSHTGGTPMMGMINTHSPTDGISTPGDDKVWDEWVAEQKGPNALNFSLKKSSSKKKSSTKKLDSRSSTPAQSAVGSAGRVGGNGVSAGGMSGGTRSVPGFMSGGALVSVGSRVLRSFGNVDYPAVLTMVDHSTGCCELLYDDGNVETGVSMAEIKLDGPQAQSPPQQVQQPSFTPTVMERVEQAAEGLVHSVTHAADALVHSQGHKPAGEEYDHTPRGSSQYQYQHQQHQRQPIGFNSLRSTLGTPGSGGEVLENRHEGSGGKKRFEL